MVSLSSPECGGGDLQTMIDLIYQSVNQPKVHFTQQ
jgi:hypothetical protein